MYHLLEKDKEYSKNNSIKPIERDMESELQKLLWNLIKLFGRIYYEVSFSCMEILSSN